MAKRSSGALLTGIKLDRGAAAPLHRQLYEGLRRAILSGHLPGGERLPATRVLAEELDVSRNTVLDAFSQLLAEGYVEGRTGAGTYVARTLPDELLRTGRRLTPEAGKLDVGPAAPLPLSRRGAAQLGYVSGLGLARVRAEDPAGSVVGRAFTPGQPALDLFPFDLWGRIVARHARDLPAHALAYQHPAGHPALREAVAHYLNTSRGVRCAPEQVVVVSGSQQAISLVVAALLDIGDAAWVEDPGYFGARGALLGAGARVVPVPADGEGIDVAAGRASEPDARLAVVTPARHFPLGATMSLQRRLALLEWAGERGAWVFEDDYDSEFRYAGRPLAALQSLDREGRVLYAGTFSKVFFPALRLGYLVVPPALVDAFAAARLLADFHGPVLEQAAMAEFLSEGHFARHVRRMRQAYAERQRALVDAAGEHLAGLLEVAPAESGMHLPGWLPSGMDDQEAAARVAEEGVTVVPLTTFGARPGLLLGYAAVPPREIVRGVKRLASALGKIVPGDTAA